jgi:hypothetical protein
VVAHQPLEGADRTAALSATAVAIFMIAQQVAGKAARDAFFLSVYDATALPAVMVSAAVLSVVVVITMARAITRLSPARVVPAVFALSGLLFVGEWALAERDPRVAAVVVYLHTAAFGAAVISSFWSVVNERFDPHTAKRVVARVAGGATVGGLLGGIAAWQLGNLVDLPVILLVLGGLNMVCAAAAGRIGRPDGVAAQPDGEASPSAMVVMREVPYLRQLALLVLLAAVADSVIDYVFKASADAAFADGAELVTFFALFHMGVGVLTFLIQLAFTGTSLEKLGLAGTVAALPVVVLAGAVVVLVAPLLWTVVALRGSEAVTENSLYRSGYELLYTPLTPDKKRPTKTLIDVGFERLGQALGAGVVLAVIFVAPAGVRTILIVFAIVCAVVSLAVTSLLHRGYVQALADSLRSGFVKLDMTQAVDATTRRTISDTTTALSRDKLMKEIAALRGRSGEGEAPPLTASQEMTFEPQADDPVIAAVMDLRSDDPARIKARLRKGGIEPHMVGHVLSLLADDRVLVQAVAALRPVSRRALGQLVDALLDPDLDVVIRRRLPRLLREVPTQRCVDGLVLALEDDHFAVRYRSAIALMAILRTNPDLSISRDAILAATRREARMGSVTSVTDADPLDEASIFDGGGDDRRLEHMFTMLSLVFEPEPLRLAYRAITVADPSLRGTGLEYLENVLPQPIRDAIWPYLGGPRMTKRPARTLEQIERELLSSMDSTGIDLEALRKGLAAVKNDGRNA